jgi:chromate reductase
MATVVRPYVLEYGLLPKRRKEWSMSDQVKVAAIAGSLRKDSFNKALLRAAKDLAPKNVEIEVFDLEGIPGFNQDTEDNPPARVKELKAMVRAADAVLIATPEYNFSVPGILKNAIDWASRPYGDSAWNGKPVAVMSASVSMLGGVRAQDHLKQILVLLNMFPVNQPEVIVTFAADKFDGKGNLKDEDTKKFIKMLLKNLADITMKLKAK